MRSIIITLLMIVSFAAQAQEPGKGGNTSHGVLLAPAPCSGVTHMPVGTVATAPGTVYSHLPAANQHYIDSIKEAKLLLKEAVEIAKGTYAKTTSVRPVMGTNFAANVYAGSSPSDNSIAISDSGYIVSVNNGSISFYKDNGTLLYNGAITSWMPFGTSISVTNPVVLYDTHADRFIFVCEQYPIIDTGKMYICFSRSSNPAASIGWYCYALRGNPAGGDGFDFPRIAVNDSELFITGNLYTSGSSYATFDKPIIHQIDKLEGYAGASMSSIYYPYVIGGTFGMIPVSDGQTAGITTGMHLISTTNSGGSYINLYKITGNLYSTPSMTYTTISTSSYSVPANSHQMGTSDVLNIGDCRVLSAFSLNNTIHFVFNCDGGSGYCGINYNRLNLTTSTNVSSVFTMLGGVDCAYPSVVSYATTATNPSVIIGYGASGSAQYPEIRAVNCDSSMSWSASTLVRPSLSYVSGTSGVAQWGNYSGTSRRHNNPEPSVWMNGALGNSVHYWNTWVAEIHDATTTPCPSPTGLNVTGVTTSVAVLHWNAVGGALGYNIQYRPSGTSVWSTATSNVTNKTITGLTNTTLYEFQVQAQCSDSSLGSFSASDTFTTHRPPISVAEINIADGIKIFPNPAVDKFNVSFTLPEPSNTTITIADVTGRVLVQLYHGALGKGLNELSFSTNTLSKGIYILSVAADSKVVKREKIVIAE